MKKVDPGVSCYFCGEGIIAPRNLRGSVLQYRDEREIPVEADVFVPTCDVCGESLLDDDTSKALDAVLEPAYRRLRAERLQQELGLALSALKITQGDLERLLGLSPGYVSKLLKGKRVAETALYRFVHLLNANPQFGLRALADVAPIDDLLAGATA
ncbi:MAG TPA: helix-turn-helix domain-containing protein [Longimicrobium sp.]|nr:helix-turn-helix domain-containing protein [Longimicrobium sp.]